MIPVICQVTRAARERYESYGPVEWPSVLHVVPGRGERVACVERDSGGSYYELRVEQVVHTEAGVLLTLGLDDDEG